MVVGSTAQRRRSINISSQSIHIVRPNPSTKALTDETASLALNVRTLTASVVRLVPSPTTPVPAPWSRDVSRLSTSPVLDFALTVFFRFLRLHFCLAP